MLRAAKASGSPLGKRVAALMDAGSLVPDEVVIGLIEERVNACMGCPGFVFDGFPRTIAQAESLDALLARYGQQIDLVLRLEVEEGALLARITKRFEAERRADDNPEAFAKRLEAYAAQTAPLIAHYAAQGKLVGVNGMQDMEAVSEAIARAIDSRGPASGRSASAG
jgi:adenylate kinase